MQFGIINSANLLLKISLSMLYTVKLFFADAMLVVCLALGFIHLMRNE